MHLGRLNKSNRAIALAGGLMLAINPKFIFDAGFQLSFASVLGIIYIYQLLKERFNKLPSFFGLRDIIFITIAAQIAVLPLSLYYFKRLPLVSLLANILVLPILSLVISLGLVSLLLGFIYSPLTKILFWFLWLILAYIIKVVEYLVILPFSYLGINSFPWWGAIICYIILIGILVYLRFQASKNKTRIKNQEL